MSDSSLPDEELSTLPDLGAPSLEDVFAQTGSEMLDPVILLTDLISENGGLMNELSQSGVELRDAHSLVSSLIVQAFLEEILRLLGGEESVVRVGIKVHQDVGPMLANAKSQVSRAKLAAPGGAIDPRNMNGNRAARRHG